jgi:hypothetical protein
MGQPVSAKHRATRYRYILERHARSSRRSRHTAKRGSVGIASVAANWKADGDLVACFACVERRRVIVFSSSS